MYAFSLVVKVSDGSIVERQREVDGYLCVRFLADPINWFINPTSEPTQMSVILTGPLDLTERLRTWMHQMPIDPPFEPGNLLFFGTR